MNTRWVAVIAVLQLDTVMLRRSVVRRSLIARSPGGSVRSYCKWLLHPAAFDRWLAHPALVGPFLPLLETSTGLVT